MRKIKEKKGFFTNKFALKTILLLTMFLALQSVVSAQCCVSSSSGCLAPTGSADFWDECTLLYGGTQYPDDCQDIEQCKIGCCCEYNTDNSVKTPVSWIASGDCKAPRTFIEESNSDNCLELCQGSSITVTGLVTYVDNNPAKAEIIFTNYTAQGAELIDYTRSAVTDADGDYQVQITPIKVYEIRVTSIDNSSCSKEFSRMISSANPTQNFDLPCQSPVECTIDWDEGPWEFPDKRCGHRVVTKTNNCDSGFPAKPVEYIPCVGPTTNYCNPDGNLDSEEGEACDPNSQTFTSYPDKLCSNYNSIYSAGELFCTQQCIVSPLSCEVCPTSSSECTKPTDCTLCPSVCDSTVDVCKAHCSAANIENTRIQPTFDQPGLFIEWSWNGRDECVEHFEVERCDSTDGSNCNGVFNRHWNLPKTVFELIDKDAMSPASTYCYNISVGIWDGFNWDYKSEFVCGKTVDPECVGKEPGDFCLDANTWANCANNGVFSNVSCTAGRQCVGPDARGIAECKEVGICDECNGPYGEFGYFGLFLNTIRSEYYLDYCDQSELQNQQMCYLDEASLFNSAIGQYKACSTVEDCYDYKTKSSCVGDPTKNIDANPCGVAAASDCKWIPVSVEDELGIGVCLPAELEKQDCTKCDENSPFGACTPEICSLFSEDNCYYNNEVDLTLGNDMFHCLNKENVGCETYDTQIQCTGENNQAYDASFVWDEGGNRIIGGNHAVIENKYSDDVLGKGKCFWDSENEKCFKDSDNGYKAGNTWSDCNNVKNSDCLNDMQAPVTTLPIANGKKYSVTQIKNMPFTVSDNEDGIDKIDTYFSIIKEGNQYERPTYELQELDIPEEGNYKLYYFSKDKSNNYEIIKEISFEIVPSLDVSVTVNKNNKWYLESRDVFLTNVTINVNYDYDLICETQIKENRPDDIDYPSQQKAGKQIIFSYPFLPDGIYDWKIRCVDDYKQEYVSGGSFSLDADTTIKNPTPQGGIYSYSAFNISIKTSDLAQCYYLAKPANDESYKPPSDPVQDVKKITNEWKIFSTVEGTNPQTHKIELNLDDAKLSQGIYIYYTACIFGEGRNQFAYMGNWGDVLYFAVDQTAPTIELWELRRNNVATNPNIKYDNTEPATQLEILFNCSDENEDLQFGENNYNYGCYNLAYCVYHDRLGGCETSESSTKFTKSSSVWKGYFESPINYVPTLLNITVFDNFTGKSIKEELNLKNLTFIPPNITICDPETGQGC